VPGAETPTILIDAGANAECQAEWLVQFGQMASAYVTARYGIAEPKVALLSNGEEETKGSPLVKETREGLLKAEGITFIGNVEGRDLLKGTADVVVTDGFTGNVALKSLEGAFSVFMGILGAVFGVNEATKAAGDVLLPELLPYAAHVDPEETGGAMLLGIDGVSIISHGSSSSKAILNACRVAAEMVERDLVGRVRESVSR
jgi:glycerol-3-phosphate acyltransferase PlsX